MRNSTGEGPPHVNFAPRNPTSSHSEDPGRRGALGYRALMNLAPFHLYTFKILLAFLKLGVFLFAFRFTAVSYKE